MPATLSSTSKEVAVRVIFRNGKSQGAETARMLQNESLIRFKLSSLESSATEKVVWNLRWCNISQKKYP